MKKYILTAFQKYGIFYCKEVIQPNNEVFLIGKFENKGTEHTFIKHPKDILLTL